MCLLIVKPAGKTVPTSALEAAARINRDGWGLCWTDGKALHTKHSLDMAKLVTAASAITKYEAVIHLRMATHGTKTVDNCHPFVIADGEFALAHNGILDVPYTLKNWSDTRTFANAVDLMLRDDPNLFLNEGFWFLVETACGDSNKIAILPWWGGARIANEGAGTWEDGVWYSNTYWKNTGVRSYYMGYHLYGEDDYDWARTSDGQWVKIDEEGNMIDDRACVTAGENVEVG